MSVIFPAFLTGALAVQVKDDLDLSESNFGLAIGAFFVGSSCGSAALGRLAERLGPVRAIRFGLATTIVANVAIAVVVEGARSLQLVLVLAGLANALTQPAINLLLVRVVNPDQLGFVMALKQSGMPSAALVGGLAVPVIALTIGWRSAYLFGAALALLAIALSGVSGERADVEEPNADRVGGGPVAGDIPSGANPAEGDRETLGRWPGIDRTSPRAKPDLGIAMLLLMAAVGVLGGGAANILVGYLVSGAVDSGVSPGWAGLLLTFGAALGVASRLIHGWLVDRRPFDALSRVVVMFVLGAIGSLGLGIHQPLAYALATPVAFAAGWAWPGLFNLVVVNSNRSAPAAATGVTQTGVYVGSLVGPIVAGFLIEAFGYQAVWLLTACSLGGAAVTAFAVRFGMARPPSDGRTPKVQATPSSR